MRVAIVGIGGVGGYIGAYFCNLIGTQKQKYEIIFIARGEHANAVKQNGIKIIEDEREFVATPTLVCGAQEAEGTFDLVLMCVKSYHITSALTPLLKNIRTDTVIIPFSNGINNTQVMSEMVDAKVLNGCVYILSHIQSPGVIRKEGKVFAAIFGSSEFFGESLYVEYMFKDAGLRAKFEEDIERAVWKKYLFISAFASLTSYYDMSIKSVYELHFEDVKQLLMEIASVAKAKNIDIDIEIDKALQTASVLPQDASTSMHLDFQNHAETELETLTGYIVEEAQKLNIATPLMHSIYDALMQKSSIKE